MADDIVTRLRQWQAEHYGTAIGIYGNAADEIERLRAAGDSVANVLRSLLGTLGYEGGSAALDLWEETRRLVLRDEVHGRVLENVKPISLSLVLNPLPGCTVDEARRD